MDLSLKSLQEAVGIREQIEVLERRLASLFDDSDQGATAPADKPKRTVSAAARKKMAEAQRARWAKRKPAAGNATQATGTGGKRPPMSAEARARLAASAKKRWAAAKRAGKSRL